MLIDFFLCWVRWAGDRGGGGGEDGIGEGTRF